MAIIEANQASNVLCTLVAQYTFGNDQSIVVGQ